MAKQPKKTKGPTKGPTKGRSAKDVPVGTGGVKTAKNAIMSRNARMRKLAGLD